MSQSMGCNVLAVTLDDQRCSSTCESFRCTASVEDGVRGDLLARESGDAVALEQIRDSSD